MTIGEFRKELKFMFENRRKKEYRDIFKFYRKESDRDKRYNNYLVFRNIVDFGWSVPVYSMYIIHDKDFDWIIPTPGLYLNQSFRKWEKKAQALKEKQDSKKIIKFLQNFVDEFMSVFLDEEKYNYRGICNFKRPEALKAMELYHFIRDISIKYLKQFIPDGELSEIIKDENKKEEIINKLENLNFEDFEEYILDNLFEHGNDDLDKYSKSYLFSITQEKDKIRVFIHISKINEDKGYISKFKQDIPYKKNIDNINYNKIIFHSNDKIDYLKNFSKNFSYLDKKFPPDILKDLYKGFTDGITYYINCD